MKTFLFEDKSTGHIAKGNAEEIAKIIIDVFPADPEHENVAEVVKDAVADIESGYVPDDNTQAFLNISVRIEN